MPRSLGIDIGTTFITTYDTAGKTITRVRHEGRIRECILDALAAIDENDYCIFTGKAGRELIEAMGGTYLDEAVSLSYFLSSPDNDKTAKEFGDQPGKIIDIGASSLTLYTIHHRRVTDIAQNTLCAAGTGLFLEEQAERLSMNLEKQGELDVEQPPLIASRCTVFAKSDLIHHQQEGRTKKEMWAGLCRSLVLSAVNTLFRGEELKGTIMLTGGVSLNKEVTRWFKKLYNKVNWLIPKNSHAILAHGAALDGGTQKKNLDLIIKEKKKKFKKMPPLLLQKSTYPQMPEPIVDDNNNEIRRVPREKHRAALNKTSLILGMDIGSTSTKLAVLDAATKEPLLDIYGRTGGDPVAAARSVFDSFYRIVGDREIKVDAFGTTGSGRKLVGKIFGADLIVNEISAHGRGAVHFDPDAETIFEIGGQDAKYIRLNNGFVADVNMNYICAAGTGSFVEEQARKLGFNIREVGDVTRGIAPPVTSDRCTVFMEQDLRALLKEHFSKEEALASVLYSVIQNYLNRVVGSRKISSKKIIFQGATARNKGLVAALENLMETEVAVSPFCHLMGSIGAALMAQEEMQHRPSRFVGPEATAMNVTSRTETCKLCRNFCRINFVSRGDGREFSWGYQCGRDPQEHIRKTIPQYKLFRERQAAFQPPRRTPSLPASRPQIVLVNALTGYTFQPMWEYFFHRLRFRVSHSGATGDRVKSLASSIASADYCFPVKIALGHAVNALKEKKPIFMPYMIAAEPDLDTAHSFYCPYVESAASVVRSTFNRGGLPVENILSPVIDLRHPVKDNADSLYETLKHLPGIKRRDVQTAFKAALAHWQTLNTELEQKGSGLLDCLKDTGRPVFLLLGRPYNLHDKGLNLGIPEKIAALGIPVIPVDMLSLDTASLASRNFHNVFWKYGQRIMAAVMLAARHPNVFPVYLSNFNCGPDSFLLSFAEEELNRKPMLILELDEHDSDGGYLTRIEAFVDVVRAFLKKQTANNKTQVPNNRAASCGNDNAPLPHIYVPGRKPDLEGIVWIPPINQRGSRVYAASFRRYGFDARSMDDEDQEALVLGKKHLRGGECLPMTLTLGNFLKHIKREPGARRHILFMPTTEGPCRFGQYNLMDRIVFNRMGLENVDVLSPSSVNSYLGLPEGLRRLLLHATTSSDVLYKMLTRVRPYERTRGDAEEVYEKGLKLLEHTLEKGQKPIKAIKSIASDFAAVDRHKGKKPLVGIVGEIYVRQNVFGNRNLVEVIEANGGEAWLAPVHEWILYTAYLQVAAANSKYQTLMKKGGSLLNHFYIFKTERNYYNAAAEVLRGREEPHMKSIISAGTQYLPEEFEGEGILTVGRTVLFAREGADMVVNVAPFGCMPGTLASSILLEIKEKFNIPMLSLFYDGDIDVNDKVAALLKTIAIEDAGFDRMDVGGISA